MRKVQIQSGVEWILFDAVGTLIYPDPPIAEAYRSIGQSYGSRLTLAEIRQRFADALAIHHTRGEATNETNERGRWRKIVASVFSDVEDYADELFEKLWEHFATPGHWKTFDDVASLSALRGQKYRLGIASNFDSRLKAIVPQQPLRADVQAVFVSSELGYAKPDLRFFRAIEKSLQLAPEQIALVGDDELADVKGAAVAGWQAIRLDRSSATSDSGTIRSLRELL